MILPSFEPPFACWFQMRSSVHSCERPASLSSCNIGARSIAARLLLHVRLCLSWAYRMETYLRPHWPLAKVKSLRKLVHPNIVKLKEVIRENDELHLVCEYMDGNVYQVLRLHILGDSTCGRFRTDFVIEPRDDLGGSTCGFVELDVRTCRCSCFSST